MDLNSVTSAGAVLRTYSTSINYASSVSTDTSSAAKERTDSVEISQEAKSLARLSGRNLVQELFPGIDTSDGISLTELSGLLHEKSSALKNSLDLAFEQSGLENSRQVELTVSYDGSILVSGDHPQKAEIEKIFSQNPELSNEVRGVAALSSLIRAGQEAVEFQKAYAEDPLAAVEQYSHLFNPNYRPEFHLGYSADSISIFFTDLLHDGRRPLEF